MNPERYPRLEDVVRDDLFPDIDIDMRQGRHIDIDDGPRFDFIRDARHHLATFYDRLGYDLMDDAGSSFYYLVPRADRLGRRRLSIADMLVGQVGALLYLDPATVQTGGFVARSQILELLASLVGEDRLIQALLPRRKKIDERVAQEQIRKEIDRAIRTLAALGFLATDVDGVRLKRPILRFAEPVQGTSDPAAVLAKLVARGKFALESASDEGDGDADELDAGDPR
ncbi:MAG: chromosome partition protein MukE [Myxococcota bacterium]